MEISQVDPHDEQAFAEWFAVVDAAGQHLRPGEPDWVLHEQRMLSIDGSGPDPDTRHVVLVARDGGHVVGAARLELPQRDNTHLCEMLLAVHPSAVRRGIGRALDDEAVRRVREAGRTTLLAFSDEPPGLERRSPGRLAAQALGYAVAQEEVRRDIDLPLDPDRVAALEQQCRPYAADYAFRVWWDRCPDDLVDDRAELNRAMSTDVPKDQMDWREEVWDAARVRRSEARAAAMDRSFVGAGAVHVPTGRLVAFTDMGIARSQPSRAYQWETLVLEQHRGRRLGMLVKLAGLQELAARCPATTVISTWNAKENAPMIAVNDALGARVNGLEAVLQKTLG